jgi:type IV pilus assembly protein PilB
MGQRLIRLLCKECKEPYEPTETELRMVGLSSTEIADQVLYRPVGCPKCTDGYKGRCGIYELLEMSSELRDMTFKKLPSKDIRAKARSEGMVALQEDAVRKLLSGITTIEEILRVTHSSEFTT